MGHILAFNKPLIRGIAYPFKHKMFVNKQSGKHPVFTGPSIIHMTKEFEDYYYLATLLKTHCKNFETLTAFGTDGEINLANAFVCERVRMRTPTCHPP